MPSHSSISVASLWQRLGISGAPTVIDVRVDDDFAADPRYLPTAICVQFRNETALLEAAAGASSAVVVCQKGLKLSEGAAALLRSRGVTALSLEGGFEAWKAAGLPLVPLAEMPERGADGATLWVTRERPKIDRIACPWLIRRFVDAKARFLYVKASEVIAVAERFGATPFDVEGVRWSHNGPECTFDTMIKALGLGSAALDRMARIVRGADTAALDLAPQAAGFLAISLGLSHLHQNDLEQLDAGMTLYDALYLWCRDGVAETHNWPAPGGGKA